MSGQCCGTCGRWGADENDGFRLCGWTEPEMPFWASINEGPDHDNWTAADQGKRCKTYATKEDMA